jgi:DUF3097, C-terminal domain/DUF3097, N-terminal domain
VRSRQYGQDVLAEPRLRPGQRQLPRITAERGLVVEDGAGQFCGAVVTCEKDAVTLEDARGRRRVFPLAEAFLLDGKRVMLARPPTASAHRGSGLATGGSGPAGAGSGRAGAGSGRAGAGSGQAGGGSGQAAGGSGPAASGSGPAAGGAPRTASGSIAAPKQRAKVARASRIYVEGRQDAELVERIWGDDLRDVGVVVEYLGGIDDLPAIVAGFSPGPTRRLGVLVDHLVDGSKETMIAAEVRSPHVLITGHPFIDVWAAVKPSVLGISRWPQVPRGVPWKEGVLSALGWPPDTAAGWERILRSVTGFKDLEPEFLGRVEELIDFVTAPGSG